MQREEGLGDLLLCSLLNCLARSVFLSGSATKSWACSAAGCGLDMTVGSGEEVENLLLVAMYHAGSFWGGTSHLHLILLHLLYSRPQ